MKIADFTLQSNEALTANHHLLKVSPEDASPIPEMRPGQFVQVRVDDVPEVFLRRPISINFIDRDQNELWLLVQNVGKGTRKICRMTPGEPINLMFPLGKSFSLPGEVKTSLLVGGGVGTAPLLFLGQKLWEAELEAVFLLGGRSGSDILQRADFERYGTVYCTTEDGSLGEKGLVTEHSIWQKERYDFIYTCGPRPMMAAVARYAHSKGIGCEVSLENCMACGIGACLCCVEKTVRGNICTCTEGPVFNSRELTWLD